MLANISSRIRRPRAATVIAFLALMLAMGGGAFAKNQIDKDEVTNVTTTGGPVTTVNPSAGPGEVEIPLANPTFTQKAGEVLLVSAEADISPEHPDNCDLWIGFGASAPDGKLGFELQRLAQRGDPHIKLGDSQALPAPAADRQVTLSVVAAERIPGDEQGNEVADDGQCDDETFTVSLRVSVTTLRN